MSSTSVSANELLSLIKQVPTRQYPAFYKRWRLWQQHNQKQSAAKTQADYVALQTDIQQALEQVAHRKQSLPVLHYDEQLPIVNAKAQIAAAIQNHQVSIICGETGSGKTTQLAKICLELGLGLRGIIGHTQPRRIATRAVATRIAEELNVTLGQAVGFKTRFSDHTHKDALIKVMTDGILLNELVHDRYLNQYEVIIIDEAHERSLNIDFLLGILKTLLPKRPDLKVIITSATIDPERFANFFATPKQPVPILEVSGRTYPVEICYRPLLQSALDEQLDDLTLHEGIIQAIDELWQIGIGDILIFLTGERDIFECQKVLAPLYEQRADILPLYARLSTQQQNRIFNASNRPRIILSTNVAETSLTVPRIRYVIDSGSARISRYSAQSRLQRLPIEPIAQAAANQRAGRCGRVMNGICIRLYSEDDFNQRAQFLDPEIKRTNLSAVLLQMAHLKLGDPLEFPFIDAPDPRQIKEGYKTLFELKAIDSKQDLTDLGQKLAKLPMDPSLGTMLLNAKTTGVLHEVLIIVAVLSCGDPRERPLEFQQAADEKHKLFYHPQSDFINWLHWWLWLESQQLSQSALRNICKRYFLSFNRLREWREVYQQLQQHLKTLHYTLNALPDYQAPDLHTTPAPERFPSFNLPLIHQALLSGLVEKVGKLTEEQDYMGVNGRRFKLFPGSALRQKNAKWIMSMEIVETSQIFARTCGVIEPEWIEQAVPHLLKTHYGEPFWSKKRGEAQVKSRLSLYGLSIVEERTVSFGRLNPVRARELLIQEGLVLQQIELRAPFYAKNLALIAEIIEMEEKTRRRDILIDEWQLFEFYQARIPTDCTTAVELEKWCRLPENNATLLIKKEELIQRDPALDDALYPETIYYNELHLKAIYQFDPTIDSDGVTLIVPLAALNLLQQSQTDWLVRGFLLDKITAVIKSLPKTLRRTFVPVPDYASKVYTDILPRFGEGNFYEAVGLSLEKLSNLKGLANHFELDKLDKHYHMNFRLLDAGGKILAEQRNLAALQQEFSHKANHAFSELAALLTPTTQTHKTDSLSSSSPSAPTPTLPIFDSDNWHLPDSMTFEKGHTRLMGYPALSLQGNQLTLEIFDHAMSAQTAHQNTLIILLQQTLKDKIKYLNKQWPNLGKLALMFRAVGSETLLKEDLIRAILQDCLLPDLPKNASDFSKIIDKARENLIADAGQLSQLVLTILMQLQSVQKALSELPALHKPVLQPLIKKQLEDLIYTGFISQTPAIWRKELPRYLKAAEIRIERFPSHHTRDRQYQIQCDDYMARFKKAKAFEVQHRTHLEGLAHYRFSIEELRISLFSQPMKTRFPISPQRLDKEWEAIDKAMTLWR